MKRPIFMLVATIAVMLPGLSNGADVPDRNSERAYNDKFGIIAQRNIFLRNRVRPTTFERPRETSRGPKPAQQVLVLTGIVTEDQDLFAFIEDTETGATHRVPAGGAIAEGKITAVDLESADFESGGKKIRVEVGHNLQGALADRSTYTLVSSSTTQPSSASSSSSSTAAPGSLEEQLKKRRQQELGK